MGLLSAGASILGGALNRSGEARAARRAHAYNKEFVQNQIQWRVQDATKAGIHPLVAMGASLTGGNAVPVGGTATGDSIRDAGTAVTAGLARTKANKRADRLADAEVELAEAQALEAKARRSFRAATERFSAAVEVGSFPAAPASAEMRSAGK